MRRSTFVLVLLALVATPVFAAKVTKESLTSGGTTRTYYLLVPDSGTAPKPLIIMLHGSGRNGRILVDKWARLAAKEGIVLAGPDSTDPQMWQYPMDGPDLLRDVVDAVKAKTAIDTKRVYLFGHSGGGGWALVMALIAPEYFAAAAVHAGALDPSNYHLSAAAKRKIPIFLAVGTNDPFFPMSMTRATRDELEKVKIPLEYWEIPYHNHDYYGRANQINDRAWKFLSKVALDREPIYPKISQ